MAIITTFTTGLVLVSTFVVFWAVQFVNETRNKKLKGSKRTWTLWAYIIPITPIIRFLQKYKIKNINPKKRKK